MSIIDWATLKEDCLSAYRAHIFLLGIQAFLLRVPRLQQVATSGMQRIASVVPRMIGRDRRQRSAGLSERSFRVP